MKRQFIGVIQKLGYLLLTLLLFSVLKAQAQIFTFTLTEFNKVDFGSMVSKQGAILSSDIELNDAGTYIFKLQTGNTEK